MAFGNGDSSSKLNDEKRVDDITEISGKLSAKVDALAENFNSLHEEYSAIRREMKYIATQNERIYLELSSQIQQLASAIGEAPVQAAQPVQSAAPTQIDYDELANKIAGLIPAQEYISPDYIASKVAEQIVMPEVPSAPEEKEYDIIVDEEGCSAISNAIVQKLRSEKLIEESSCDYDIVIDEEGLNKITERVTGEVNKTTEPRFKAIEEQLAEIKELLASGVIVRETATAAEAYDQYVAEESTLVTVSEVTQGEEEATEQEELAEEIAELVEEIDEIPAEGEIDDVDVAVGGVDFANMMRYNRSFIARIIQSTDDQKEYYGRVKTALLSYAKVNSNISWGAERFNKGRETIARFKIRGKTLCLYLALDPYDYEPSVYHQYDVSDNKSMHGTPMMVKIKSPRGVKKAIRLIDDLLARRNGVKRTRSIERDYAAMYPYESIEELIEDGLVKDVSKK